MNKCISKVFIFVAGMAVGSLATWKYVEKKYQQLAQEEIDSVKEVFCNKKNNEDESSETYNELTESYITVDPTDNRPKNYDLRFIHQLTPEEDEDDYTSVIDEIEYGQAEDYDMMELTYFRDGKVANGWLELIPNVDGTLGTEFFDHFGDLEGDSVYVRNDKLKTDFEIVLDSRTYSEALHEFESEGK